MSRQRPIRLTALGGLCGDRLEQRPSGLGSACFGERSGSTGKRANRRRNAHESLVQERDRLPEASSRNRDRRGGVTFDQSGRPSFNTLQNFGSSTLPIFYYAFDVLIRGSEQPVDLRP